MNGGPWFCGVLGCIAARNAGVVALNEWLRMVVVGFVICFDNWNGSWQKMKEGVLEKNESYSFRGMFGWLAARNAGVFASNKCFCAFLLTGGGAYS